MSAVILIVDDVASNIKKLQELLESEYYNVIVALNGYEAKIKLQENTVDIVLLDMLMPGISGYEVCQFMKENPKLSEIPIIIMTSIDEIENKIKFLEVGIDEFITKPLSSTILLLRVKALLKIKLMSDSLKVRYEALLMPKHNPKLDIDFSKHKVLTLLRNKQIFDSIKKIADSLKLEVRNILIKPNEYEKSDLVIIEHNMLGRNGFEVLRQMKLNPNLKESTFVIILEKSKENVLKEALESGFDDFIFYPLDSINLRMRISALIKRKIYSEELKKDILTVSQLTNRDELTKLFNKRYFTTYIDQIIKKSIQEGKDLYLLILDIDQFKEVNDKYGHVTGDKVLYEIANIIVANVRPTDVVARFGGDEFVILMYDLDLETVKKIASRLLAAVVESNLDNSLVRIEKINKTISIGICKFQKSMTTLEFIEKADTALHQAKNNKKNQSVIYTL